MIEYILPFALYAETHYRFLGISPSALFRREPEIVFDMPRRLAPRRDLPVTLLINDVHRYPVQIESVQITVAAKPAGAKYGKHDDAPMSKPKLFSFDAEAVGKCEIDHALKKLTNAYVLTIPRAELSCADLPDADLSGPSSYKNLSDADLSSQKLSSDNLSSPNYEIFVNACLRFRRIKKGAAEKKVRTVINDNFTTSSKFSLRCLIADSAFPAQNLCTYGDAHCHSSFSRSHVEWGPPVGVIDKAAHAGGLDFAAVTDHSYDLACEPDNYLRQDKKLRLWELYKSEISAYNGAAIIIPGEEISALNAKKKVVHLCGLGIRDYIPGSLDGARRNIRGDAQLTVEEAAREIERQGGVAFAAHPASKVGLLQSVFLRRGTWNERDLAADLDAVQIANGDFFDTWTRAKKMWVSTLLAGRRLPVLAGSDAHGDLNRYRAVAVPQLRISEVDGRYMGFVRTGVYGRRRNAAEISDGIREGATFATNGPFISICRGITPDESVVNKTTIYDADDLWARAISGEEFGTINKIQIFTGATGAAEETMISEIHFDQTQNTYEAMIPINTNEFGQDYRQREYYIRAEVHGKSPQGHPTAAATSACFISSRP